MQRTHNSERSGDLPKALQTEGTWPAPQPWSLHFWPPDTGSDHTLTLETRGDFNLLSNLSDLIQCKDWDFNSVLYESVPLSGYVFYSKQAIRLMNVRYLKNDKRSHSESTLKENIKPFHESNFFEQKSPTITKI